MLVYLGRGSLPWQGLTANSKAEKFEKIRKLKTECNLQQLCSEAGLPNEFVQYFQRVQAFAFDEEPPYNLLRQDFRNLLYSLRYEIDYQYDWLLTKSTE